jgi:GAF domain-containing protein
VSAGQSNGARRAAVERQAATKPSQRAELSCVLNDLLRAVEAQSPGMLASILLIDFDGETLRHGAAPSLPAAYNAAIDGIKIGPAVGSCGTAAYLGHPVYVTDIENDLFWADYKHLALEHGLRACWSVPIQSSEGAVLGTFAIYHLQPRSPTREELDRILQLSDTAAMAIEHFRERPA